MAYVRPCPTRWAAALGMLLCASAMAQGVPEDRVFQIHFTGPISQAAEKFIHEGLHAQDPRIEVWVDPPTQSALARTPVILDRQQLQAHLSPVGLVIGYMGPYVDRPEQGALKSIGDGFPAYTDTGDPVHDQAAFLDARAEWFSAHAVNSAQTQGANE